MKKLFFVFVAVLSVFLLTSCKKEENYPIAMITDIGDIDDKSFNQGTWEGVKEYAEEYGIPHKYYKPTGKDTDSYVAAIELAISNGAKIVITPGFLFEGAINICQKEHPDVKFVLIDGNPANAEGGSLEKNTYSILYAEEEVGFLAGYAAVLEGHTKLGFMGGMAVPAVVRYGQGFIFGANAAAELLDVDIVMQYHYTGDFEANSKNQTRAAGMYNEGVTIIFACGGAVGQSVMAAAQANNGKVIGVDVDQSAESETVITSATKGIGISAYRALESFFGGDWEEEVGGKSVILDAEKDGVGLIMGENARFTKFTKAEYDELYQNLVDKEFSIPYDLELSNKEDEIVVARVTVTVVGN
ncbi:MAG TPA: BMP family ABC transporter substrate-binding protein [Acholeplasmataceae bacterium]|nr:BMP family ABC transporter substrate-binding protein [Acholeplasmataceae bacterium]